VHHCGIEGSRPRGHSSLTGAVDSQLKVERAVTGEVIVTVEWAKDFAEGTEVVSRLEPVELGTDPDGDPITSMVVVPADGLPAVARKVGHKLSPRQRLGRDALAEVAADNGVDLPVGYGLPLGIKAVTADQWRDELYCRNVLDRTAKGARGRFRELRNQLHAKHIIGVRDEWVWLAAVPSS
jgi:hypothetical protein